MWRALCTGGAHCARLLALMPGWLTEDLAPRQAWQPARHVGAGQIEVCTGGQVFGSPGNQQVVAHTPKLDQTVDCTGARRGGRCAEAEGRARASRAPAHYCHGSSNRSTNPSVNWPTTVLNNNSPAAAEEQEGDGAAVPPRGRRAQRQQLVKVVLPSVAQRGGARRQQPGRRVKLREQVGAPR